MTETLTLKNPPIKEIVFTISFNENVPITTIESFVKREDIASRFSSVHRGMSITANIGHHQSETTTSTTTSLNGFILRSQFKVIQVKIGSFAFHRIEGYEPFDSLLAELKEYWYLFIDTVGKLTINNIALRYVNFIQTEGNEDMNDLFSVKIEHPFGKLDSYIAQYRFIEANEIPITANVVFADQQKSQSSKGVLFDIILNRKLPPTAQSMDAFVDMKAVKNDIFFKCITEKTIKRYNQ